MVQEAYIRATRSSITDMIQVVHQEQALSLSACRREFVSQDAAAGGTWSLVSCHTLLECHDRGSNEGRRPNAPDAAAGLMYTIRDLGQNYRQATKQMTHWCLFSLKWWPI